MNIDSCFHNGVDYESGWQRSYFRRFHALWSHQQSLAELEMALAEAMAEYFQNPEKLRQLCAYPWILEQVQGTG